MTGATNGWLDSNCSGTPSNHSNARDGNEPHSNSCQSPPDSSDHHVKTLENSATTQTDIQRSKDIFIFSSRTVTPDPKTITSFSSLPQSSFNESLPQSSFNESLPQSSFNESVLSEEDDTIPLMTDGSVTPCGQGPTTPNLSRLSSQASVETARSSESVAKFKWRKTHMAVKTSLKFQEAGRLSRIRQTVEKLKADSINYMWVSLFDTLCI